MSNSGLSEARLGRMHDVMTGYVERGEVPGLVMLVSRHGEAHVEALGKLAAGGSTPIPRDPIFRIPPMTNPIDALDQKHPEIAALFLDTMEAIVTHAVQVEPRASQKWLEKIKGSLAETK